MSTDNQRQPGDYLLEHYFPNADEDTRERARRAFRDFAAFILRMGNRLERHQEIAADSTNEDGRPTISEAHPEPQL